MGGAKVSAFTADGVEVDSTVSDAVDSSGSPTGFYALRASRGTGLIVKVSHEALSASTIMTVGMEGFAWLNFTEGGTNPSTHHGLAGQRPINGPMGSFALYYLDKGEWTWDNLFPLVSHASFTGGVAGRMYDGLILYSGKRLYYKSNNFSGPTLADFRLYMNSSFEALDVLENVSGNVMDALGDGVRFKVVMTAVYFKGDPNASWAVDRVMERWASKGYKNLSLSGFLWGYSEGEIDAMYDGVAGTADRVHALGLKLFWSPFFLAPMWPYWHDMGFDYVIMQPNFAYNRYDPWRFEVMSKLIASGEVHGVNFEISYTRLNGLTVEENANAHLDAGFKYGWWGNAANIFYRAPGYLDGYANGSATVPTRDRPIYDRQYQFLRLDATTTSRTSADTYVFERPPTLWRDRGGAKGEVVLRSDSQIATRAYLRFPPVDRYSSIHSAIIRLDVLSVGSPCLVAIYMTDPSWDEGGTDWLDRPAELAPSGLAVIDNIGQVSLAVPKARWDLSFMLAPQMQGCDVRFSSREGPSPPEVEVGYFASTITRVPASEDAYVSDQLPSSDFGTLDHIMIGRNGSEVTRGYLKFNASALPKMFHEPSLSMRGLSASQQASFDVMYLANTSWNESTLTWSTQPNGKWEVVAQEVPLGNDMSFTAGLGRFGAGESTLVIVQHAASGDAWGSFSSKESGSGPSVLVIIQAFEQQF